MTEPANQSEQTMSYNQILAKHRQSPSYSPPKSIDQQILREQYAIAVRSGSTEPERPERTSPKKNYATNQIQESGNESDSRAARMRLKARERRSDHSDLDEVVKSNTKESFLDFYNCHKFALESKSYENSKSLIPEVNQEEDRNRASVGEVDREEGVSHVVEVNRVGVVEAEVEDVVSLVDEANRVDAVDRVVGANHEVVVELGASPVVDHVMVAANPENGVILVPLLIIIVVGRSQECVGDLLQLHLVGNQHDHVTLVGLEVKIEGKSICHFELSPGPSQLSCSLNLA